MFDGASAQGLDPAERRARLRLARSARIGPVTFREALDHFGSARAACARLATVGDRTIAHEEAGLAAAGGRFLVYGDPLYPAALAALPDAPPVLAAIGDMALLASPILAIVGARQASAAACRAGRRARGDPGRHRHGHRLRPRPRHRCRRPSGRPVLRNDRGPGGRHRPGLPAPERRVARGDRRSAACSWARRPGAHAAVARSFPRRNRIVSGLSLGVVVIEAAAASGSLITAHRAAEQGREVFVVPGSPMDPRYAGSNSLIRDGAILARDANDILSVLHRPRSAAQPLVKARVNPELHGRRRGPVGARRRAYCG